MYEKTLTFENFNGEKVTQTLYFHLSQAELFEMNMLEDGALATKLQEITAAKDASAIVKSFKDILLKSYGKKSSDGSLFLKNDQIRQEFECSAAYSAMFMLLTTDAKEAEAFVKGVMPKFDEKKLPSKLAVENKDN